MVETTRQDLHKAMLAKVLAQSHRIPYNWALNGTVYVTVLPELPQMTMAPTTEEELAKVKTKVVGVHMYRVNLFDRWYLMGLGPDGEIVWATNNEDVNINEE